MQATNAKLEQLPRFVEQAIEPVFAWNLSGEILYWNRAAEKLYGFSSTEAVGKNRQVLLRTVFPDDRTYTDLLCQLTREKRWHGSLIRFAKDGRHVMIESQMSLIEDMEANLVLESNKDLLGGPRRKPAISRIDVDEEQRRHLACELHDEVGQILSTVMLNLKADKVLSDSVRVVRLDESIRVVEHAIQQVRNLSLELWPSMLRDLGLISTLRWYADRQAQLGDFELHFACESLGRRRPPDLDLACYRVVQEALTNVLRHANARHVWVEISEKSDEIWLTIRDDGIGFDVTSVRKRTADRSSIGLCGMRERVSTFDGHFCVESQTGQGTTVQVRIPIHSTRRKLRCNGSN